MVSLFFPRSHAPVGAVEADDGPLPHIPAGLNVLVVDDNKEIAALATTALEERGCRTQQAHSGSDALAMLHRGRFDVLLTDIVMPGSWTASPWQVSQVCSTDLAVVLMTAIVKVETERAVEGELCSSPSPRRTC
jgi:CheY-like chemotaxis protein